MRGFRHEKSSRNKGRVVVQKRMNAKKKKKRTSLGDAGETDEDDVEIPLRTRTTTRQRYDEIKKARQRRSGQQRCLASLQSRKDSFDGEVWSAGLVWGGGGAPEHVFFPSAAEAAL